MATGRGLRGWTDGRARQTQAASGELWAGIEGSRGLRRRTDGRAGTSKAGKTDWQADGLDGGPNRANIARYY